MVSLFGRSPSSPGDGSNKYQLVSSVASEAMGIGKSSEVLTVLGGKASCRRKFVLNVHLVDEHGRLVSRDLTIVASVAYAHDLSPVVRDEKPFLAEPPLFTTFNGVEFPAQDRPTRMASGRASFKLAISLLSSKCDNRLFCICFSPQIAGADATPVCAPCYSKPIRSISRKRTQSCTHVSPPPQLLLTGLEKSPLSTSSAAARQYGNNNNMNHGGGGSFESDSGLVGPRFGNSPSTSTEDDGEGGASPAGGANLQCSSRSGSVTSMHYLSPTSAAGGRLGGVRDEGGRNAAYKGVALVVHETSNASAQSTAETTAGLSTAPGRAGGLERFIDMETSGSTTGGCMASVSCSPVSSTTPADKGFCSDTMKITTPPCSLSLRLSPGSDSGSPTSAPLTSESSYENKQQPKDQTTSRTRSSPLAVASSPPSFNAPTFPQTSNAARPFRPFATVGPCTVLTAPDFQVGNGISLARQSLGQSAHRCDDGGGGQASNNTSLERAHQLGEVSPARGHHQQGNGKVDSVLHSFTLGTEVRSSSSNGDDKFNSALTEISLEEEERSLQYIEVSLQEVSREVQRRMGELRSKRRRLLEDEARMHSIIFQSASWIESLCGRYSL